jgi:hypothetical protein
MILLNDDDLFIYLSGSKCNGDYTFTKGLLISGLYPLLLQSILSKMALVKPYPNATYDMADMSEYIHATYSKNVTPI